MKTRQDRPTIDETLAEWLSGFADAESTFIIRIQKKSSSLSFRMKLHKDDIGV